MKKILDPEDLLKRYRNGTCLLSERQLVESWHLKELHSKIIDPDIDEMHAAKYRMWKRVKPQTALKISMNLQWLYYAASVVLIISLLIFWKIQMGNEYVAFQNRSNKSTIIAPGGNKAVLTLDNGKRIFLDEKESGLIASQGQANIFKTKNGVLEYKNAQKKRQNVKFNTINVPKGGVYTVVLADGTEVWLNSSSMIRFPTVFNGATRQVEITGEAYFQIAKNRVKPFVVVTVNQKIQVVGTHFNVHAYPDEDRSETTLLEGKILITKAGRTETMNPGQQAINFTGNSPIQIKSIPDPAEVIAWRDGYFSSSNESLYSVMSKIARWYDVEIEYRGNFTGKVFGGTISKFKSVKEVLDIIELTGSVHFKIEGRRIIVTP